MQQYVKPFSFYILSRPVFYLIGEVLSSLPQSFSSPQLLIQDKLGEIKIATDYKYVAILLEYKKNGICQNLFWQQIEICVLTPNFNSLYPLNQT